MIKHASKENRREVTDLFYNRSHLRKTTQNLEILKRESKNQVTSGGQRTYLRGQNYGKVQAARTKEAEAIPGTALARARVLQKKKKPSRKGRCWERQARGETIGRSNQEKKKKAPRHHTRQSPALVPSPDPRKTSLNRTSPINRTRNKEKIRQKNRNSIQVHRPCRQVYKLYRIR